MRIQNCPAAKRRLRRVSSLTALVRLKAKQAKYDLNFRNETKGEIIDMRATGESLELRLPLH
jgi:hypothetical protein